MYGKTKTCIRVQEVGPPVCDIPPPEAAKSPKADLPSSTPPQTCGANLLGCAPSDGKNEGVKPDINYEFGDLPKPGEIQAGMEPSLAAEFSKLQNQLKEKQQAEARAALESQYNKTVAETKAFADFTRKVLTDIESSGWTAQKSLQTEMNDIFSALSRLFGKSISAPVAPPAKAIPKLLGIQVTDEAKSIVMEALTATGEPIALITSVSRTPGKQAEVIYEYAKKNGIEAAYALYGPAGDKIIDIYAEHKGDPEKKVLPLMKTEALTQIAALEAQGERRTELMHVSSANFVFDIGVSSIKDRSRFALTLKELQKKNQSIVRILVPPLDREAFHIEIRKGGLK
ncbi:hypothetical protein ML401_20585 [Bradyrhizobium sp. 62B]|uniref:hypothetical protein n=1 Tax=Bradyrhizobium sp. 62B TaxID=2898442 RepID=UPI0025580878|nr:hypothetical protein ML401_20585 [Bradyrhizobium sp. 62B]